MNTLGTLLTLTCAGESHGPAIVGILDGMPAGIRIDPDFVRQQMCRRRPGGGGLSTSRSEVDEVELLSGLMDGLTLGTPIAFVIRSTNQHSADYEVLEHLFRPSHADYAYQAKYGIRDHRGGGRASARATAAWVAAGAIAMCALAEKGIKVEAKISEIAGMAPDDPRLKELLDGLRADGNTVGGVISGRIFGLEAGVGEPVFGKISAELARAMFSINAVKGFEMGMGFEGCRKTGDEVADTALPGSDMKHLRTAANHSGGTLGGITSGEDVTFRVAFKPVATLGRPMECLSDRGTIERVSIGGRHDAMVLGRAVVIVESMAALVTLDQLLQQRARQGFIR